MPKSDEIVEVGIGKIDKIKLKFCAVFSGPKIGILDTLFAFKIMRSNVSYRVIIKLQLQN